MELPLGFLLPKRLFWEDMPLEKNLWLYAANNGPFTNN
jgi:hypothetical protein